MEQLDKIPKLQDELKDDGLPDEVGGSLHSKYRFELTIPQPHAPHFR